MTHVDQRQPDCGHAGLVMISAMSKCGVGGGDVTDVGLAPTSGAKADIAELLPWADAVEKVAEEMLWNRNAQRSNPAGRFLESTLRIRG